LLATNWQQGVGSPLGAASLQEAMASVGLGGVSVPEPSINLLLPAALSIIGRYRKSRSVAAGSSTWVS
jgi:hypothetical protein